MSTITFKVTIHYIFSNLILFNTNSYIKFNSKLKIDQKKCAFKNQEQLGEPGNYFEKMSGNPVYTI